MRFSIIGTGASGTLMSVILKSSGHVVHAQDKDVNKVAILKEMPEWKATGKTEATGKPDLVTSDAAECIEGTDYIMVCTTTDAHAEVAEAIAGSVRPEQTVILNPGHVGGVLNFRTALIGAGCRTLPRICEAADMMFACRTVEIGHTFHSGVKNRIPWAQAKLSAPHRVYTAAIVPSDISEVQLNSPLPNSSSVNSQPTVLSLFRHSSVGRHSVFPGSFAAPASRIRPSASVVP